MKRILLIGVFLLAGCVQVPSEAVLTARQVTIGIERQTAVFEVLVDNLREKSIRQLEDDYYDEIYRTAEGDFREGRNIDLKKPLTPEQQKELTQLVYIRLIDATRLIDQAAIELKKSYRLNSDLLSEANEQVVSFLQQTNRLTGAQQQFLDLSGIGPAFDKILSLSSRLTPSVVPNPGN
jgi:hypothetical protein